MSTWAAGYVSDLGYTHGYYRELTPTILNLVALSRGQLAPDAGGQISYCELGCGQGFSMNLLAAANPHIHFHANDFNPSQIGGARRLASAAGLSNVTFYDASFANFADEPGLPDGFDVISLHGIYSWISAENRRAIVDFIRRRLKVGGLVYISYNAMPGWSAAAPMRQLMYAYGKAKGGPTIARLGPSLEFVEEMQKVGAGYFRSVPNIKERLERLKGMSRNYVAHEYFNDIWEPFYHSSVAEDMGAAKLSYLGSAALLEHVDVLNLTADQRKLLAGIEDLTFRETLRDYMVNQQFRRDVFVKGLVSLSAKEVENLWLNLRVALSANQADIPMKVTTVLGEATLHSETYTPILNALSSGPRTIRELASDPSVSALGWARIQEAALVLSGMGHLQPCLQAKDDGKRMKSTKSFNQVVLQHARENWDLQYLASPVTGGGVAVGRSQQLYLLALQEGRKQPGEWADFVWQILAAQGQKILKDGNVLDTAEENIAELNAQAKVFAEKQLPVLKALGVA